MIFDDNKNDVNRKLHFLNNKTNKIKFITKVSKTDIYSLVVMQ